MSPYYFSDLVGGQVIYRCLHCRYDSFSRESIDHHSLTHGFIILPDTEELRPEWWMRVKSAPEFAYLKGIRVGLALLTWNTEEASLFAAHSLVEEYSFLKSCGATPVVIWVDNGSTDLTDKTVLRRFGSVPITGTMYGDNKGQSKARNLMIDQAIDLGCDFLFMIDGDVQAVNFSVRAMMLYLLRSSSKVGCIGFNSLNCTHRRDPEVAEECRQIDDWMIRHEPAIAWTNYGLFRREVIEKCRFDESGPFGGPGWGFEDDDYWMQMTVHGFTSVNTQFFRYLHRRRHSSIANLGETLASKVHGERKAYLLDKWKNEPSVRSRLDLIANHTMPVLV